MAVNSICVSRGLGGFSVLKGKLKVYLDLVKEGAGNSNCNFMTTVSGEFISMLKETRRSRKSANHAVLKALPESVPFPKLSLKPHPLSNLPQSVTAAPTERTIQSEEPIKVIC